VPPQTFVQVRPAPRATEIEPGFMARAAGGYLARPVLAGRMIGYCGSTLL